MIEISEKNIDFLYSDLKERGLRKENLIIEMIDHICCIIEPEINRGISFNNAYNKIIDSLNKDVFEDIQHESNLSTNLKFQKMKKSMYISGVLGTLMMFTGMIFKTLHWPGASVIISFGSLILIMGFLPLFFYISHTEQKEKKSIFLPIIGYFTISLLIIGPLFKIMHWPGANSLLFFGPLVLALVFLPIYLIQVFKKSKETKTNFAHTLLLVGIGVTSFLMLIRTNPSLDSLKEYDSLYHENMSVYKMVNIKNLDIVSQITSDSVNNNEEFIKQVNDLSNEIHVFIDEISTQMIKDADGENYQQGQLDNFGKTRVYRKYIKENDNGEKLEKMLTNYKTFLLKNSKDKIQEHIINEYLISIFTENVYDYRRYYNLPVIEGLLIFSKIDKNVELAKHEILENLE